MKPAPDHDLSACHAVSQTLSRIAAKWSVLVIVHLGDGSLRFSELRRRIGNISQKMLTSTVRGLERAGYLRMHRRTGTASRMAPSTRAPGPNRAGHLTRTVTPTAPPGVDYARPALGRELLEPIEGVEAFARRNQDRIAAARVRFDGRAE